MYIVNTIVPVFLIIALGAYLRKLRFFSADFVTALNRLVYWVGLPALLFYKVAAATYDLHAAGATFLVLVIGMLGCILVGYLAARLLRIPAASTGALVQGAFRGNLVYVGLFIIIYSFADSAQFDADNMENIAVLVLAWIVPVYNVAAVIILLAGRHKLDRYATVKIARQIITNPLVLACLAGAVYSAVLPGLPLVIARTCTAVGDIALPLALLGTGATLVRPRPATQRKAAITASIIKVFVAPAIGYPAACWLNLGPGEMRIAMLFLACPTAVASFVMADQLGADGQLSAEIIVISVLFSIIPLCFVTGLF